MDSSLPPTSSMWVIKRSGERVTFDRSRIERAIHGAMIDVDGEALANAASGRERLAALTDAAVTKAMKKLARQESIHIEDIQDLVELTLMTAGEHKLAREYIRFRDEHAKKRDALVPINEACIKVKVNGQDLAWPRSGFINLVKPLAAGFDDEEIGSVVDQAMREMYDGITSNEAKKALLLASRTRMETDPKWNKLTTRMLLATVQGEALKTGIEGAGDFARYIALGIQLELLDPRLAQFDLALLEKSLVPDRDDQFDYLGLQTLADRYLIRNREERIIELPQWLFMRVAMGLALNEDSRELRAAEFYNALSSMSMMTATPTLFNSGTVKPQLSSCFLTTVSDDLDGIYESIKENALLSKWAGGLGNDWTPVRALGSHIKGTNGKSQGIVPFLKVVNDTAVAVNQGGKRKGAVCAYLETWHLDIEEFLELRKNTGDDRRRTHDMNTANWIPDLFMKRVMENANWTLFTPSEVPDLHDKYGKAFEEAYTAYEDKALRGEIRNYRSIPAVTLWRKMLTMLFETGHPWITFKDPCNLRSPQQHAGVVHSSNLCTEITLNTSETETAVCNLASINVVHHLAGEGENKRLNLESVRRTVRTAMRMLDNVIDINHYASGKAKTANLKHRPVGLGIMGYQDALYALNISVESDKAVEFSDLLMEAVCYYAYEASADLAKERGVYESYEGSLWSKGILPLDSIALLAEARGDGYLEMNTKSVLNWDVLRGKIEAQGMRNSNCVAIAPTATISNIIGVSQSIEPTFQNLYVKSNLSGEFTVVNEYLVEDLKALGMWDAVMVADLKHFDGSLGQITRIPEHIRKKYRTVFEIDSVWIIEAASRRQKWIDQAQSLNIYMAGANGKKLDETYKLAWKRGLKTTYYLRTLGKSSAEKSTGRGGELNAVSAHAGMVGATANDGDTGGGTDGPKFCSIDNPECEACQ